MALTDKLSAIGVAIREKTGGTELLTLDAMPAEILSITTGDGGGTGDCTGLHIPDEALTISGNLTYGFAHDRWNWFIETCGDKIVTKDISDAQNAFTYTRELKEIPFVLNFDTSATRHSLNQMFQYCEELTTAPKFVNCKPSYMESMFASCYRLRNFPEGFEDGFDWSWAEAQTSTSSPNRKSTFQSCNSLRSIPMDFLAHTNPNVRYSYTYFYYGFSGCRALDELVGLPIPYTATYTSNTFYSTFDDCSRLKEVTFATQEDGTPLTVNWSNQTIDLSTIGFFNYTNPDSEITNYLNYYNSGITIDKRVTDDATYAALKDDPDWFTTDVRYSRYNHDSAVNTINSLPDASSGGSNVIKFRRIAGDGDYGSLGKAISNLTEEEIAVATAKGWTVTLV